MDEAGSDEKNVPQSEVPDLCAQGTALLHQKKYMAAYEYFHKARLIDFKNVSALQGMAVSLFGRGGEIGVASCRSLLGIAHSMMENKSQAELLSLWCERGDLFSAIGAISEALSCFREAELIDEGDGYTYKRISEVELSLLLAMKEKYDATVRLRSEPSAPKMEDLDVHQEEIFPQFPEVPITLIGAGQVKFYGENLLAPVMYVAAVPAIDPQPEAPKNARDIEQIRYAK